MESGDRRRFVLFLGVTAGLTACGGGGGAASTSDHAGPTVTSFVPPHGASGVLRGAFIEVKFDESINAPVDAIQVSAAGVRLNGSVESAGSTIRFIPERPLAFGREYTVQVTAGVTDAAGNPAVPTSASFRTKDRNPALGLGAYVLQQIIYEGFGPTSPAFDAFARLADNGIEWARTQVTTIAHPELRSLAVASWRTLGWQETYWCCLEMSATVLKRAAEAGLRLQVGLFLSHKAANAGAQDRPPDWVGLSPSALAAKVEEHARSVAAYYASQNLNVEVFELGSECDFRFCGYDLNNIAVPAGIDWSTNPQWMFDNLWSNYIPILNAAIRGIKAIYPTSRVALHIAAFGYSAGNVNAVGFFERMKGAGVAFDIAGLSYPYSYGGPVVPLPYFAQPEFLSSIDALKQLGVEVQILEFNYPAATDPLFRAPAAAYPYTVDGQARFVEDFAVAVRGRVSRINYWCADFFPGITAGLNPEIEVSGLFSSATVPRSALGVFNSIAEAQLLQGG